MKGAAMSDAGFNKDLDPRVLEKVRALLAKAESTPYAEEATAFTAKAQELMASHAINQAMLESRGRIGAVTSVLITVPAPYAKNKVTLLGAVARPNRCRVVRGVTAEHAERWMNLPRRHELATLFGHRADIQIVEMLFTSLLLQATNVMLKHGSVHNARGDNTTRSFRHSFLLGFAGEVERRLQITQNQAASDANTASGGSVLPVLASRADEVDRTLSDAFPDARVMRVTHSSRSGWDAGTEAGRFADVGGPGMSGGSRGSLQDST